MLSKAPTRARSATRVALRLHSLEKELSEIENELAWQWHQRGLSLARVLEGVRHCLLSAQTITTAKINKSAALLMGVAKQKSVHPTSVNECGRLGEQLRDTVAAQMSRLGIGEKLRTSQRCGEVALAFELAARAEPASQRFFVRWNDGTHEARVERFRMALEAELARSNLDDEKANELDAEAVVRVCAKAAGMSRPSRLFDRAAKRAKRPGKRGDG
jgi:hypothetical protein